MKNRLLIGIIALVLMVSAAACSGKKNDVSAPSVSARAAAALSNDEWETIVLEYEAFVDEYAEVLRKTVTEGRSEAEELDKLEDLLGYWAEYFRSTEGRLSEEQEAALNEIHVKLIMVVMGYNE